MAARLVDHAPGRGLSRPRSPGTLPVRSSKIARPFTIRNEWPQRLPRPSAAERQATTAGADPRARQGPARWPRWSALLELVGPYVDVWKLGWGTAYLDSRRRREARPAGHLRRAGLHRRHPARGRVGPGEGRVDCLDWAADAGLPVRGGVQRRGRHAGADKRALIAAVGPPLHVLAEVGAKDPAVPVSAAAWAAEMAGDLEAGATWVVTEGRESGTVGLYEPDGSVREDVVEAVVAGVGQGRDRLRGAPQAPAGLAHPPLRRRRQPRQRRRRGGARPGGAAARPAGRHGRAVPGRGTGDDRVRAVRNLVPRRYREVAVAGVDPAT